MLVALDSNVFIAALSPNEEHSLVAQRIMRNVAEGEHKAVASSIAYGEVLGLSTDAKHILDLEGFFTSLENLSTMAASDAICLSAGQLRKHYGPKLKLPDALHLATALAADADVFVTNDKMLAKIAGRVLPTKTLGQWR